MTSKTSKEEHLSPKVTFLQNITNKQSTFRNCCVKLPKLVLNNMNGSTKSANKLKRNSKVKKESNQDCNSAKKLKEENTPSDEHAVEEIVKTYELLQKVISKKYVTVSKRLDLDFVPLCAENIEYCHKKHYKKALPPGKPTVTQMHLVRNSLQQSRYKVFISLVSTQCRSNQFPGDLILTNIVQMLLTLNPESKFNAYLQPILDQLLWLFDVILIRFPPCWLSIRPSYMNFLNNTIEMSKLVPDKRLHAKNTVFEVVLLLLEDTLEKEEVIQTNLKCKRKSPRGKDVNLTYFDDEYHNMQHWEKYDNEQQSFTALSNDTRLSRLMQVLHLIAKLLEMDLAMWMLRYHKHPAKHIFCDDRPLAVTLFSLSNYTRSSVLVKKVISLFALCVAKNLDEHYLKVMGRFLSLLANIQNLCEIDTTPAGITYPHIGPATTSFIMDFFNTAEVNMKRDLGNYMRLIRNLRCHFVRYEYIDIFLKRMNPAAGKMCPEKIVENFRKNRWLECTPAEDRPLVEAKSLKNKSVVYRRDYLQILLYALQSYCEFHGTKEYLAALRLNENESVTAPEQPQESITKFSPIDIDLSAMSRKIAQLEAGVDMSVKLREPRTEIPVVNIRVNCELFLQYRNDLKYTMILQKYIGDLQRSHSEDFSKWMEFLNAFAP